VDIGANDQQTNIKGSGLDNWSQVFPRSIKAMVPCPMVAAASISGANVNNPWYQNDGPTGFNGKALSTNQRAKRFRRSLFRRCNNRWAGKFKPAH